MELTATFRALLEGFQPVFTAPSYATFCLLMTGWILSVRHRYVTDLIISSDSVHNGHFSDYHRFFSHAQWRIDDLWKLLTGLLIDRLLGPGAVILLAGDDTLCRKRGLGLFGAGMHHDPLISSRAMKLVSWGHDWVTLSLIVVHPWWAPSKVFALPICMRLYRNRQGVTKGRKKASRSSRASCRGRKHNKLSKEARHKQARRAQRKARRIAARQQKNNNTAENPGRKLIPACHAPGIDAADVTTGGLLVSRTPLPIRGRQSVPWPKRVALLTPERGFDRCGSPPGSFV